MSIKNILKYILILVVLIVIALFVMIKFDIGVNKVVIDTTIQTNYSNYLKLGNVAVKAEIVNTDATRQQGLSGRENLKEDEGMFFVFDKPDKYKFWMKDMNFPIDIIWFNQEKEVVFIAKNTLPESYPELFGPEQDTLYVLEVMAGFTDKYKIKTGDSIE